MTLLLVSKAEKAGGIEIGDRAVISSQVSFRCDGGKIILRDDVTIGKYVYLSSNAVLEIDTGAAVGPFTYIGAAGHGTEDLNKSVEIQPYRAKGIYIGKNASLGADVTVLDGVSIGEGCIVAAGSIVNTNLPSFVIAGGYPARVIRKREPSTVPTPAVPS